MDVEKFDHQLWRDFDWDTYIESQIQKYPTQADKDELRQSVEVARTFSRLYQKGPDLANMRELLEYQRNVPGNVLLHAMGIMTMIANTMYTVKREEGDKVTFAMVMVGQMARICRDHSFAPVEPALTQFFAELGENTGKE